jgi:hypothetical protein
MTYFIERKVNDGWVKLNNERHQKLQVAMDKVAKLLSFETDNHWYRIVNEFDGIVWSNC